MGECSVEQCPNKGHIDQPSVVSAFTLQRLLIPSQIHLKLCGTMAQTLWLSLKSTIVIGVCSLVGPGKPNK
eukprot:8732452-Lingulodinium_polyedra.AAC.1